MQASRLVAIEKPRQEHLRQRASMRRAALARTRASISTDPPICSIFALITSPCSYNWRKEWTMKRGCFICDGAIIRAGSETRSRIKRHAFGTGRRELLPRSLYQLFWSVRHQPRCIGPRRRFARGSAHRRAGLDFASGGTPARAILSHRTGRRSAAKIERWQRRFPR